MDAAVTIGDFVRAPVGKYLALRKCITFCAKENLSGIVVWGCPKFEDAREWGDAVKGLAGVKRARLLDVRRIDGFDPRAFDVLAEHIAAVRTTTPKGAVVVAGGIAEAIAGGFRAIFPAPELFELFTDPVKALEWLGCDDPVGLAAQLDELQARCVGTKPLLRDLRALLGGGGRAASLPAAAASLGLSERSLQRKLREHGTSFQAELGFARVGEAQRMLIETEASVSEIAFAVGCATPQHFATLFRRVAGTTPRQWRDEERRRLGTVR